ncbi:LpxI family protein [Pelosinus baikalensis]|uniref:UDP-2,3-diacylglucosamine diphosphatase LpxI n=1 Tax=Pelosinus baikalensis TaxID=2892015 RepID=A0ABS8HQV2_9FIRM|nr:UDP-2,3-diacylglucosamine diphosphatase LpxI [Pelosinus baikalensis]MCC5464184.1 UDP-2,3-diacylglucosamine diphosphatase LpxI [Pelosinus baikalensis]
MKIIGLLAGIGRLPVEFARAARGMGFTVIAISVVPGTDEELDRVANKTYHISVGQLQAIITTLKEEGVTEVTMIGKVTKELMFAGAVALDSRIQKLLAGLTDNSDDTIMLAFVRELAMEGLGILDQTALIRSLMPGPGVLTDREPTEEEQADLDFGFTMAKEIGRLDIGQTVVVKNCAVMAVEAIEGTDACIRRGGELGRCGVRVVKVAKPNQDMRFDVPTVGPNTIESMLAAGATALAMEAGKTLLVDRQTVLKIANNHGITILVM